MGAEKFQDLQVESISRLEPQERPVFRFEPKSRKRPKLQFKGGSGWKNPLLCRTVSLYGLLRPSTDCVRPTQTREDNVPYSVHTHKQLITSQTPSQNHPELCSTIYLRSWWPSQGPHNRLTCHFAAQVLSFNSAGKSSSLRRSHPSAPWRCHSLESARGSFCAFKG